MRRLGIDLSDEIYATANNVWRIILPSPMISPATFDANRPIEFLLGTQIPKLIFREDSFDPTSRIRRGRFYGLANSTQPSQERVLYRMAGDNVNESYAKPLYIFDQYQLSTPIELPRLLALGSSESLWRVASPPERISTGEVLFTLKARHAFGILPEVDQASVPDNGRKKVIETLEKLSDAAHRESPGSIIDRARDAAQWCLATWAASEFGDTKLLHEDLGPLLEMLVKKREMVAFKAAEVVRRLHSRVKPNEQERRRLRAPMEADAELALNSVGFLIRELGWASE